MELPRKNKGSTPICKIRNERRDVTTDSRNFKNHNIL